MASKSRIVSSALWAAYGDALGFITELADRKTLKNRLGAERVETTQPWSRRIGGRFGARLDLPTGCYSDDTQLRLATSRSIRSDGKFDVETFAKVELPVWLSYSLGGGLGTKAAAKAFRQKDTSWFSNFFETEKRKYVDCGGNGAAMRIQPHVWCSEDRLSPDSFSLDIIRNAVCTHGHPRGIFGAIFHGWCLSRALAKETIPEPYHWEEAVDYFAEIPSLIEQDDRLSTFWLPTWEERTGVTIEEAASRMQKECREEIGQVKRFLNGNPEENYVSLVEKIGGLKSSTRGSGTKTAILASALCRMCRNWSPDETLRLSANLLGSDTDTISTMAGAILGAVNESPLPGELRDTGYIQREASRTYKVAKLETAREFKYPDLANWTPPKNQVDTVRRKGDRFCVSGLGLATPQGKEYPSSGNNDSAWQLVELQFGQSIFAKRRENPSQLDEECAGGNYIRQDRRSTRNASLFRDSARSKPQKETNTSRDSGPKQHPDSLEKEGHAWEDVNLDAMTDEAIDSGFDEEIIGRHIIDLIEAGGIEASLAYVSIVAKAKIHRDRQKE